ncbi:hypothetical protein [Archaeoglobus veneficus]|uniref:Uncharacterized protein n=1 Tax=Archaeoglobus veneficus (strain DSM 11195 / SNP6) TaxID=693661 RepID=F2KP94_ARCVS|nr:hypothetical protein [Archaeoglobus veneficus]AEA47498.1 hypothetical protein Arcve_1496 [Archaeoglobus veneficus SNP6]
MRALYRELGLSAREAAEVTGEVVEIIAQRLPDITAIEKLADRFEGKKLCFALLLLGRLAGMSFALSNPEKARAILADFSRLISTLEKEGMENLVRLLEEEILEEVYAEVDKLKDVV